MTVQSASLPFISDKKVQPRIKAQVKVTKIIEVARISDMNKLDS